jgi:2-phospho-L-lactate/phosphoenolpyruvate guanylyltransferase
MTLWAVIPVKTLWKGKSRLAGVLKNDERERLNKLLLEHTLSTLRDVPEITQTLIISRDVGALALARQYGARTVQEDGAPTLNSALKRATLFAMKFGVQRLLILPSDIPFLNKQDLQEIIDIDDDPPVAVLVPDRHEDGTNAMLISPPGRIDYSFGIGSFKRHCQGVKAAGFKLVITRNEHIGLDLDTPEDLNLVRQFEVGSSISLSLLEEK